MIRGHVLIVDLRLLAMFVVGTTVDHVRGLILIFIVVKRAIIEVIAFFLLLK